MTAQASLFSPLDVAITDPGEVDVVGGKVEFHPTRERDILEALILGMREAGHAPLPFDGIVRESACGEGALVEHVEALCPSTTRRWHLHELKYSLALRCNAALRESGLRSEIVVGDFLAASAAGQVERCDLAITNPGFSRAIEWAAAELQTATHVALLLPSATVWHERRADFLREHMADRYDLPWRPDFDGRGGFPSPVSWWVWGPGRGGRWWPLRRPEGTRR